MAGNCRFRVKLKARIVAIRTFIMKRKLRTHNEYPGTRWRSKDSEIGGHIEIFGSEMKTIKKMSSSIRVFSPGSLFHNATYLLLPSNYSTDLHKKSHYWSQFE